jgi:hypothetical protein
MSATGRSKSEIFTAHVWTPERDAVVRARYFTDGAAPIAADLGVTVAAVFHRASRLGLLKSRPWTEGDDKAMRELWGEMNLRALAKHIGRTQAAVYTRGQILGLTSKVPQGFEYLTSAAVRTGYGTGQLRKILAWAGVSIGRAVGRPRKQRKTRRHFGIVVPYDVDQAIVRWLESESLNAAALARGVTGETLARRLALVEGVPPKPPGKRRWRIPTALIDRALAMPLPPLNRPRGRRGRFAAWDRTEARAA